MKKSQIIQTFFSEKSTIFCIFTFNIILIMYGLYSLHWFKNCWFSGIAPLSSDGWASFIGAAIPNIGALSILCINRSDNEKAQREQDRKYNLDLLLRLNDHITDLCSECDMLIQKKSFCMDEVQKIQKNINKSSALLLLLPRTKKLIEEITFLALSLKNLVNLYHGKETDEYIVELQVSDIITTIVNIDRLTYNLIQDILK